MDTVILSSAEPDESARQTILGYSTMEGNRPVYEKNRIIFAIDCKPNPFFAYYWIEFILLKGGWELYFQSASQNKK